MAGETDGGCLLNWKEALLSNNAGKLNVWLGGDWLKADDNVFEDVWASTLISLPWEKKKICTCTGTLQPRSPTQRARARARCVGDRGCNVPVQVQIFFFSQGRLMSVEAQTSSNTLSSAFSQSPPSHTLSLPALLLRSASFQLSRHPPSVSPATRAYSLDLILSKLLLITDIEKN